MVTGSSALELQDKLNEPLTGRKFEYHLFPFSIGELCAPEGLIQVNQQLEMRMIFGSYPDIVNNSSDARELLMNIAGSYLYKDILSLDSVRRPAFARKVACGAGFASGQRGVVQ